MKIALINIPLPDPHNPQEWIPLPPRGYGGIQWVVTHLLNGYLELGHQVWLLGAPSTQIAHRNLTVVQVAEPEEIHRWLKVHAAVLDIIHDHSNGEYLDVPCPIVTTHHLTGRSKNRTFPIYLSESQRKQAGDLNAPVIRLPVNPRDYIYSERKENYWLYLGRVSKWKGVYEAAQLAHQVGIKLIVAGPAWEKEYLDQIQTDYPVEFIGEVGGAKRRELLSKAKAVTALSQMVMGPWGDVWCEPGSAVISEAAVSGTPVIGSSNGCLKEIVPKVGVVFEGKKLPPLPSSATVFTNAVREWHYLKIAGQYLHYFEEITNKKGGTMTAISDIKQQLLLKGGVVIPSVLNGETLAKVDRVTRELIQSWEKDKSDKDFWWYREESIEKDILYRIHNLDTKNDCFKELIDHPAIQELRTLIFGKATKPTACAMVYKSPNGSAAVPWHRDPIDVPPNTVYNFSIYLDESDQQNGALEIVPGSHLDATLTDEKTPLEAKPGDVIVHDVRVYHGSSGANDQRMRHSIIIEFQPEELP